MTEQTKKKNVSEAKTAPYDTTPAVLLHCSSFFRPRRNHTPTHTRTHTFFAYSYVMRGSKKHVRQASSRTYHTSTSIRFRYGAALSEH